MSLDLIFFLLLSLISISTALGMLLSRNAVYSALFLVLNFITVAVFFLLLGAPFIAMAQVTVYAGAIMVLFLFVIMLLGVDREESLVERLRGQRPLAIVLGLGMAAEIFVTARASLGLARGPADFDQTVNVGGNAQALSRVLFRDYFLPFEVTSILLIVAAIAAMVLAQRRERTPAEAAHEAEVA